ncbi:bsr5054 [Bradyrhizobium diazoefficiens USDA 110]|uniref:Bsr5054 protein n=1 Tax=Bradyrhizobium diazoefficiens (strain JCM 10833 / BCRC 13528 / IAM 13628 / NBRC 14792 / USDA 110) TaxID=224911 RepID=Q89K57_BRADU|nr:hypothetical protein CO678_21980 [Bradyrhizobium diazoefficiens]QBP23835.1 hypothetical protein Bdiaspc4_26555 [Bradyrhizobium diazoefficiens]BAC50319.1 bsr5054 [Bradyrhizobium diazoefficiens USDA 110]
MWHELHIRIVASEQNCSLPASPTTSVFSYANWQAWPLLPPAGCEASAWRSAAAFYEPTCSFIASTEATGQQATSEKSANSADLILNSVSL